MSSTAVRSECWSTGCARPSPIPSTWPARAFAWACRWGLLWPAATPPRTGCWPQRTRRSTTRSEPADGRPACPLSRSSDARPARLERSAEVVAEEVGGGPELGADPGAVADAALPGVQARVPDVAHDAGAGRTRRIAAVGRAAQTRTT